MGDSTFHSALSPSARHRWGACPGSVREEAKYPEKDGGHAANDGTRTHALLERAVTYEFIEKQGECGPAPYFGEVITDEYGTYTVDAARAGRVNVAMEYIRDFVAENGGTVIAERRVFPDGLVLRADMSGTVDVQIANKFVYVVLDFKDGMNPVAAKDNPQLELYGLGVLAGLAPENYPKKFRFVIVQPKLATKGLPAITSHELTTEELLALAPRLIAEGAATEAPDAPLVPGESQCKYCRAKGACSALVGKVMTEVGMMFGPVNPAPVPLTEQVFTIEVPPFFGDSYDAALDQREAIDVQAEVMPPGLDMSQQAAARDPHTMNDDQLRQLMESAPLVRQLLAGVEEEIARRLHSGKSVPGFKLVQGRGSRAWALPDDQMEKKLTGMGIPKGSLYKQTLISPAQAEALVWDKKGEKQQLSDRQKKSMTQEYIKTNPGKPCVAPESDPRPAIEPVDASSLFAPAAVPLPAFLSAPVAPTPEPVTLPAFLQVPDWLK